VKVDSEVQENSVHDKFGELLLLLFGDSYRMHQTAISFQSSMLRAMNTIEITIDLMVNKQLTNPSSEVELTSHSWISYIKSKLNVHGVYVTHVSIADMNDKFASIKVEVVISASSGEECLARLNSFYQEVVRNSYDKAFNSDMETLLDKNTV
jgi:hypothetical protein